MISGNAYNATGGYTADNAAAVLVDGRTNGGNGLIYFTDSAMNGGGVKLYNGANGLSFYAKNLTEEGDYTDAIPPVVWYTSGNSAGLDSTLEAINLADPGPNNVVVQNDSGPPGPVISGSAKGYIVGPFTVLSQWGSSVINQAASPRRQSQSGFFNSYAVGETDIARRISGLSSNSVH